MYAWLLQTHADSTSLDLQGPIFVHEPAYKIEFSNNTGGHIHCSGHANPYPEVIHVFVSAFKFHDFAEYSIMQQLKSHIFFHCALRLYLLIKLMKKKGKNIKCFFKLWRQAKHGMGKTLSVLRSSCYDADAEAVAFQALDL